jgi:hypothetical protein
MTQFREDCRMLLFFVDDAAKNDWLGYGTREKYISDGLGLDLELVPWAIQGLRRIDPDRAIGFDEAIVLGQHGGNRKKDYQLSNRNLKGGTNVRYTVARLRKEDRSDLAERVERGELSANAAAIEAGFRKEGVTIPLNPEGAARTIKRRFTAGQIRKLKELL